MKRVLAFDFGASSGRGILAEYGDGRLSYHEVHRFENCPREKDGHFRWDFEALMAEVRKGIEKAGAFDSIGFDTWGVDFGLLDEQGRLLGDPVHYRDSRTRGMVELASAMLPEEQLYAATGNQVMAINTLFQLLALKQSHPDLLARAKRLLFITACLEATDWCRANYEYFRGDGFSSHFRCCAEMPVTMLRVNIAEGVGPVLQLAEGFTAHLPNDIHTPIDLRTDRTWPTTWFVPRLTGRGAFADVYSVMANWGANHGVTV